MTEQTTWPAKIRPVGPRWLYGTRAADRPFHQRTMPVERN